VRKKEEDEKKNVRKEKQRQLFYIINKLVSNRIVSLLSVDQANSVETTKQELILIVLMRHRIKIEREREGEEKKKNTKKKKKTRSDSCCCPPPTDNDGDDCGRHTHIHTDRHKHKERRKRETIAIYPCLEMVWEKKKKRGLMSRKKENTQTVGSPSSSSKRHREAQPYVQNTALLCSNT
jgi:hypothetical protein